MSGRAMPEDADTFTWALWEMCHAPSLSSLLSAAFVTQRVLRAERCRLEVAGVANDAAFADEREDTLTFESVVVVLARRPGEGDDHVRDGPSLLARHRIRSPRLEVDIRRRSNNHEGDDEAFVHALQGLMSDSTDMMPVHALQDVLLLREAADVDGLAIAHVRQRVLRDAGLCRFEWYADARVARAVAAAARVARAQSFGPVGDRHDVRVAPPLAWTGEVHVSRVDMTFTV